MLNQNAKIKNQNAKIKNQNVKDIDILSFVFKIS
jgi:hypothetical protein